MEHLYFWGVADKVRAVRLLPPEYPASGVTAYRNLMSDTWYAPPLREIVNRYYFQDSERLPQYLTEEVLRARMAELPTVESAFGWAAQAVEQDERGARVTIVKDGGDRARDPRGGLRGGLRRRALDGARADRHRRAAAPISTSSWCSR